LVNISGGTFSEFFNANSDSVVNVSGGSLGDSIRVRGGSAVNLIGSDFVLDGGQPLDGDLTIDNAFVIPIRDVTLSGRFADGTAFSYDLNTAIGNDINLDFVSADSTLTVTLASAAPEFLLGDCNLNGVVDFEDIGPFIEILMNDIFLDQADCDRDGEVTFLDIAPFVEILMAL